MRRGRSPFVCGDDDVAKRVDGALQDERAHGIDAAHERHRETLRDHVEVGAPVEGEVLALGQEVSVVAPDVAGAEQSRERLAKHVGERRHLDAKAHSGNEHEVKAKGHETRHKQEPERGRAVDDGAEESGQRVVEERREEPVADDDDVGVGLVDDFGRGVEELHREAQRHERCGGEDDGTDDVEHEYHGDRAAQALAVVRAETLGDDDAAAAVGAPGEVDDERVRRVRGVDGRDGGVTQAIAGDHHVADVVRLLQRGAEEQRCGCVSKCLDAERMVQNEHVPNCTLSPTARRRRR